jgi:hypothetical protein
MKIGNQFISLEITCKRSTNVDPITQDTIEKCIKIAMEAHEGQRDRDGNAVILHPLLVGSMGVTDAEKCVGFLHDVVEDTDWTFDDLRNEKVETMPVPHDVAKGQTVEIRCEMKKEGNFANTLYTIRYFQYEGKGTLKMDNGTVFLPNDRYLLENEKFRLYYTSQCDETQNFIVVVEDNFGNSHEMEFDFNNSNTSETESDSVPAVSPSTSKQIRE